MGFAYVVNLLSIGLEVFGCQSMGQSSPWRGSASKNKLACFNAACIGRA